MKVGDLVKFKDSIFNLEPDKRLYIVERVSSHDLQSEWVILHNHTRHPVATQLLEIISESR